MKNLVGIGLVVLLGVFLMSTDFAETQATKYGYLNTAELLEMMPEVKQARARLKSQRDQSQKLLEAEGKKFQEKYQQALSDAQAGTLTPKDQARIEAELAKMQQDLLTKERTMSENLLKKEQDLFDPIQTKVRNAIKTVAKEKGFRMIFDSSAGILLHSEPADNVMVPVKAKLGI